MTQNGNVDDSAEITMEKGKILNDKEIDTAKLFNFGAYSSALKDIISNEATSTPLTIGIFGDWGTGKTSLMSSIRKKLEEDGKYLFSWDDVPGEDDGKFRKYLIAKHHAEWAEKPKFHKSKKSKYVETIRIDKDENSAEITIDKKAEKATLKIRDVRIYGGIIKLYLTLYVNLIISWLKGKLRQYQEASYNPPYDLTAKTEYLFNWDDIPGNDEEKLLKYLKDDLGITWVENADISKPDNKTIQIKDKENSAKIKIDKEGKKATVEVSDGRTYNLKAEKKYQFSWNDIPRNDDEKLKEYFKDVLLIGWAKGEGVEVRESDDKTIRIVKDKKSAKITIDEAEGKATLQVNDDESNLPYLFNWNDVPGKDDEKLIKYFKNVLDINWVENAKITKPPDDKTIQIGKGENSAKITIDEVEGKATVEVSDGRIYDLIVKTEYLFNWDDVPGKDDEKLLKYLKDDLGISWMENADISKPDDKKTIRIVKDENSAEITMIDEAEGQATVNFIDDDETYKLPLKTKYKYLFRREDITIKDDDEKLIKYFKNVLDISWAESAKITKPDGETIRIVKGENSAEITIGEPTLKIGTGRTHNLTVETEDGKPNIYEKNIGRLNIYDIPSEGGVLKVKCIWFNAWEQSFGPGNLSTAPSLLYHIHKEFGGETTNSEKIKEWGRILGEIAADGMLRKFAGGMTVDEVKDRFKTTTESRAKLSKKFQEAINDYLAATGYERVVVFIDDLDRCLPENVVDILETVKLFLETEKCIFVLGVDRGVIVKSIDVRYKDFATKSDGDKSLISGDRYLEKIIQLIFQLPPLHTEDIRGYITELDMPKFYKPSHIRMISEGIGKNPRRLKRFLNDIELQRTLANSIDNIKTIIKYKEERELFEALLIEWGIINSYYKPEIRDILRDTQGLLAKMHEYVKRGDVPLFNWDAIYKDDKEDEKLKTYLMEDIGIKWAKDAEISKSKDGKTISIVGGENSTEITIDEGGKKVTVHSEGGRIHDLEFREVIMEGVGGDMVYGDVFVVISGDLKKFKKDNSEVWDKDLKKLITEFLKYNKLPKTDDVDRVIHLSQATESQAPEEKEAKEKEAKEKEAKEKEAKEKEAKEKEAKEKEAKEKEAKEKEAKEKEAKEKEAEKVLTKKEIVDDIRDGKEIKRFDMSKLSLNWVTFSDVDLIGANMSGASLVQAKFKRAKLSDANLSGADLSGADLIGATLIGANLCDANLSKAKLREANLSGANLSGADLSGADLSGADLSGADLSGAKLAGADLRDANLSKAEKELRQVADWSGADLRGANLSGAKLAGADLHDINLSKAKLRQADLSGANLSGADLSGANLVKANLRRARMDSCTLKDADLRFCNIWYAQMENADLSGADLHAAEFYSANMRGAIFENAKLKNTSLASANLSGAKFKGAEFSGSNLDNAMLDGADFVGADLDSSTRIYSLKKARWTNANFDPWVKEELKKVRKLSSSINVVWTSDR